MGGSHAPYQREALNYCAQPLSANVRGLILGTTKHESVGEHHSRIVHFSSLIPLNQYCFVLHTDWSIVHKFASRCSALVAQQLVYTGLFQQNVHTSGNLSYYFFCHSK